jgi:hypothetical protein
MVEAVLIGGRWIIVMNLHQMGDKPIFEKCWSGNYWESDAEFAKGFRSQKQARQYITDHWQNLTGAGERNAHRLKPKSSRK